MEGGIVPRDVHKIRPGPVHCPIQMIYELGNLLQQENLFVEGTTNL